MMQLLYQRGSKLCIDPLVACSYLMGLFACTPVIKLMGYSLYIWFACVFILMLVVLVLLRVRFNVELLFLAAAFITFVMTNGTLSSAYSDNNFKGLFAIAIASIVGLALFDREDLSSSLIRGVLLGARLNVIWIFVQTASTAVLHLDINNLVFVEMLRTVEVASQTKASGVVSSGLCWNAGGIAAALIIAFMLEKRQGWKVGILVAGLLTQSSTLVFGLTICLLWKLLRRFKARKWIKVSRWLIVSVCILFALGALGVTLSESLQESLGKMVGTSFDRLLMLLGNADLDSSAVAHFDYYNNLPKIVAEMTPLQFLFGYGIDCSGMPYTALTMQYHWLDAWFIESDFVNTFLGMGIIGLLSLYLWLGFSVIKTFKVNQDVGILLIVFMLCGYFYDIQSVTYYWLLTVEMALVGMTFTKPTRLA